MTRWTWLLGGFILATNANAVAIKCPGKVTQVLDWPSNCDNLAFRLDSTGNKWWCAISNRSNSMVLTAFASGKEISPWINDALAQSCDSIENYHKPLYRYLNQ
ncbi:hypothetical protein [Microbulbifer spongiae]|uniref:DUF3019 domain-containing protein n=1 Tax=Microbulbifer spongiae TaxID=2944933 RepID=A0ABY9EH31_9GAMM|nr:hypothetical protein [Microbulbifer sp. MI-G]WKD51079.1 hypothetical protein M8T91_06555 [Microbulbifer sp. MI-G]